MKAKRTFKDEVVKAWWRVWDAYVSMLIRLVGSTKAFAFCVGTILFIIGPLSEAGWLIIFGIFVGGNVAQKSKWMNGNHRTQDYEA